VNKIVYAPFVSEKLTIHVLIIHIKEMAGQGLSGALFVVDAMLYSARSKTTLKETGFVKNLGRILYPIG
jgi:hypothetical protein